jgi:hypothetical protein
MLRRAKPQSLVLRALTAYLVLVSISVLILTGLFLLAQRSPLQSDRHGSAQHG